MREYVDGIQGEGAWDRMHDLIDCKELFGWKMPPVEVDGKTVSIFPGTDREVTLERIQAELRKCLTRLGVGDFEEVDPMTADDAAIPRS